MSRRLRRRRARRPWPGRRGTCGGPPGPRPPCPTCTGRGDCQHIYMIIDIILIIHHSRYGVTTIPVRNNSYKVRIIFYGREAVFHHWTTLPRTLYWVCKRLADIRTVTSAVKRSIGFTIGFHNHIMEKGLLLVESALPALSYLTPSCGWVDILTWTPPPQNWLYLRHSS